MNLEKRLKEFEESCLGMASNEASVLKQEIEAEIEEQIKTEIEEYINRKNWNFNKTIEKLEKNYMKEVFKFQTDCKKEILIAKKEIDLDLKKEVTNAINNYTETEKYKEYLFNNISNAINCLENKDKVILGLVNKDIIRYKDEIIQKFNVETKVIDDFYIGGCIIETDTIRIDNSLKNNIEEKMQERE